MGRETLLNFGADMGSGSRNSRSGSRKRERTLWRIWGTLTDPVDWPGEEAEIPTAEPQIKRAAEEWLQVAHDPQAPQQYLDRWLYDEFGITATRLVRLLNAPPQYIAAASVPSRCLAFRPLERISRLAKP